MKETIILLGAKPWSMTDEKTGQIREGISLHYVMSDNLKDFVDTQNQMRGYQPVKQSISMSEQDKLKEVPGIYSGDFSLKSTQGKTILALNHLEFIGPVK